MTLRLSAGGSRQSRALKRLPAAVGAQMARLLSDSESGSIRTGFQEGLKKRGTVSRALTGVSIAGSL
jgi:hypothetical protein